MKFPLLPFASGSLEDLSQSFLGTLPLAAMDTGKVLLGIFAIGLTFAYCAVELHIKARRQKQVQETIRLLIEKGQPIPPELLAESRTKKAATPGARSRNDRRAGIIVTSIGVGFFAAFSGLPGIAQSVRWFALIPICTGLAFLFNGWLEAREKPLGPRD